MAYSETRIVIGGLAHVPVLIFIANFIKGKFGIKTEETKDTVVKVKPVKIIELKDTIFKERKAEAIKKSQIGWTVLNRRLMRFMKKEKNDKKKKKKERLTISKSYQTSIYLALGLYLFYLHLLDLCKIQFQLEFSSCKLP